MLETVSNHLMRIFPLLIVSFVLSVGGLEAQTAPLYGLTAFPYDMTLEAQEIAHDVAISHSNLYAMHMDTCLPWREALLGLPYPQWLTDEWAATKARIPVTHQIYIALTPTAMNRHDLAPSCGSSETTTGTHPAEIAGARMDATAVKTAYRNYVQKIIATFQPHYLNLGVEISELALYYPQDWSQFESLYLDVLPIVRSSHPTIKVGIEMVLQSLLIPEIAAMVKPAVDQSDYLGISFYPYGEGEGTGLPALEAPPNQWQSPLDWVKTYTTKPIAICETGYTTKNHTLDVGSGLFFRGDEETQRLFLRDLISTAKRDSYLFVVWFVPIDYDALLEKLPPEFDWTRIWVNTGLLDRNLNPKPAYFEWFAWDPAL